MATRIVWRFEDECLAPEARLRIDYTGPNPFRIYQAARGIMMRVLEVQAKDYWERDFRWDISSDPRPFFVRIYVNKGIDSRTSALIEVIMQGVQPSDPKKEGKLTIQIGGRLKTQYTLETVIQKLPIYRALIWLYHRIFYNRVRRNYLGMCTKWIEKLHAEFKSLIGAEEA